MKRILLLFIGILLISCNGKTVFSETDSSFAENRWQKSDIKTYEFEIAQDATPHELEVFFSHVYGYQFPKVPMIAEITYPDGIMQSVSFDVLLQDNSGAELGDCSGDYCDLTQKIEVPKPLSAGKYKVRLMHDFNGEYLPNVLGLGLRVEQLND